MIRSLNSWYSSDAQEWTDSQRNYAKYLKKIGPSLPPPLARLARQFTLHDDRIAQVQVLTGVPAGRDALVTIKLYRDGCHGTAALLVLHLVGIQGSLRKSTPPLNIMFFDVEKLANSTFRLSFALEEEKTLSVKFRNFGYYLYDYRSDSFPH